MCVCCIGTAPHDTDYYYVQEDATPLSLVCSHVRSLQSSGATVSLRTALHIEALLRDAGGSEGWRRMGADAFDDTGSGAGAGAGTGAGAGMGVGAGAGASLSSGMAGIRLGGLVSTEPGRRAGLDLSTD